MIDWETTDKLVSLKDEISKHTSKHGITWDMSEIDNAIKRSIRCKEKIAIEAITSKSGVTREKSQSPDEQTQSYLLNVLRENDKFNFVQLQGYLEKQGQKIKRKELEAHLDALAEAGQLPYEIRG